VTGTTFGTAKLIAHKCQVPATLLSQGLRLSSFTRQSESCERWCYICRPKEIRKPRFWLSGFDSMLGDRLTCPPHANSLNSPETSTSLRRRARRRGYRNRIRGRGRDRR